MDRGLNLAMFSSVVIFGESLQTFLRCVSIELLRKLLSILLLVVFSFPVAAPLFAGTAEREARLPACCRKDGKHHCMMSEEDASRLAQTKPYFTAPTEKCPYYPKAATALRSDRYAARTVEAVFASLSRHPAGATQTDAKRRISRDRSRLKRGPPTSFLL